MRSWKPTGIVLALSLLGQAALAQGHVHEDRHPTGHLHFSHPLVTESISPDTKLRLNVGREWERHGSAWELEIEGEYAFHPSFSIEIGVPYVTLQHDDLASESRVGNLEAFLKFANYAFADAGLVLGYGLELGIPTGDQSVGIGSNHLWSVAPVLNIGYKRGRLELVGFSLFEIPFNQRDGEEVETELLFNASSLFHASQRVQALLEFNGKTVLSGDEAGETLVLFSPGIKVAPSSRAPLFVGLGARLPLTDTELDVVGTLSFFYHF